MKILLLKKLLLISIPITKHLHIELQSLVYVKCVISNWWIVAIKVHVFKGLIIVIV